MIMRIVGVIVVFLILVAVAYAQNVPSIKQMNVSDKTIEKTNETKKMIKKQITGFVKKKLKDMIKQIKTRSKERKERCIKELVAKGSTKDEAEKICRYVRKFVKSALTEKEKLYACMAKFHVLKPNATYQELRKKCLEEIVKPLKTLSIVRIPRCPPLSKLEPLVRNGRVIGYRCTVLKPEVLKFKECVRRYAINMSYRDAVKKCRETLKIQVKKIPLPERELVIRLRCLANEIPEIREKVEAFVKKIKELKAEHREEVEEITKKCTEKLRKKTNITEEELKAIKEECSNELREANEKFMKEMREIKNDAQKLYEEFEPLINATCVSAVLSAREIALRYKEEREKVLENENLTEEEKRELLKELIKNKTQELKARGKKVRIALLEGLRELMSESDLRALVINAIKQDKSLIKDVLKDPEIKQEIIEQIAENPEDLELLKEAIADRVAKIKLINKAKKIAKLRKQLLRKEILTKILPLKARKRLARLNITNLDTEQIGNETTIKAEGVETGKLFFVIPVKVPIIMRFKDDEILEERKPWWAFLVA